MAVDTTRGTRCRQRLPQDRLMSHLTTPSDRADGGCLGAPKRKGVPSDVRVIEAEEQTEHGKTERNDRLLAVAAKSATHRSIQDLSDLSDDLVSQVEHFFVSYNSQKGKRSSPLAATERNARGH
jgi:hypothetical protein